MSAHDTEPQPKVRFIERKFIAEVTQIWAVDGTVDPAALDEPDLDSAVVDRGEKITESFRPEDDWQLTLTEVAPEDDSSWFPVGQSV